jgi:alpha-1,2-mannosyltransferase
MVDIRRWARWCHAAAPQLFVLSAIASIAVSSLLDPVDLHVYTYGGAALPDVYSTGYLDAGQHAILPFVYPPFAAIVFFPLHLLPFWMVALGWRIGVIAALYATIRLCLKMIATDDHRTALLWTACTVWLEPIVGNLKTGTIGVFLMLMLVYAAYSTRWWVSGLLVGVAAGIKLTPAIAGLYLAGQKRWVAAVFSAVVFAATLGAGYLVAGDQVAYYFTSLMGNLTAVDPVSDVHNQSWRGGIIRILGYDPGMSLLLGAVLAATGLLCAFAWRALRSGDKPRDDKLGQLLVIMVFGLLASPISWTNHWTWLVPLLVWLLHGQWSSRPGARALWWAWLTVTLIPVPNTLAAFESSAREISRPWYLAWAGLVYPVLCIATFAWTVHTGRAARRAAAAEADADHRISTANASAA